MHFVTEQAVSSPTFKPPPVDGSFLLPHVFDHNAKHSPTHPLFLHPVDGQGAETITWSEGVTIFRNAARIFRTQLAGSGDESGPVVAILASTDQITYLTIICGLMLAGYIPFPISTRNSDAAVAHLLQASSCTHVFVNDDHSMQSLAESAGVILAVEERYLKILRVPDYRVIVNPTIGYEVSLPANKFHLDDPAVLMHSSGSTAFPKVITLSHRVFWESGLIPSFGEIDLCGEVLSVHALPMFHMLGLVLLPYAAYTGMGLSCFSPHAPAPVPTPERVFDAAMATNSTMLISAPTFLESWGADPARVAAMSKLVSVIFGGGPLHPKIGDNLVKNGVNVAHLYGMTEASCLSVFVPKSVPKEGWDYFPMSPHVDVGLVPILEYPGVHQIYFKKCPTHTPAVLDAVIDGVPALNTKDLALRHPTNPNLWKMFGRQDDQIVHSNGEKTNPVPIEKILNEDPSIKYAIMFGRGSFNAGVIVFPVAPFDPADLQQVIDYRRKIWSTVERANKHAPTHSRIFKEMILVANPGKPMQLTAKGTPRRQAVLDAYAEDIRDLYLGVEDSFQKHLIAPVEFDPEQTLQFVRTVVGEVMDKAPGDDEDFFQHGCDSLQATWIRNTILHAAANSPHLDYNQIPENVVYSHATAARLAKFLAQIAAAGRESSADDALAAPMVEICHGSGAPVIVLPGATGSIQRFFALRQHSKQRIWGLQITDSTPLNTMTAMVEFWKQEILKKQPHGPYHIAAFSGSSIHGVLLTKLLRVAGEEISQLTFIDHCPALYAHEKAEALMRERTMAEYIVIATGTVTELLEADPSVPPEAVRNYTAAARDDPSAPSINQRDMRVTRAFLTCTLEFLSTFYPSPGGRSFATFIEPFNAWLHSVDVPMVVLVAEYGVLKHNVGGAWPDLGASQCGKSVTTHYLSSIGHFGIFNDPRLAQLLAV